MTEWMLGALTVLGASLTIGTLVAVVAYRFFQLGLETGKDHAWAVHDRDHVGELTEPEPEDEPAAEQAPFRVTVVDRGSGPRHALRADQVWTAPEDVEENMWPSAGDPGTERLPAVTG